VEGHFGRHIRRMREVYAERLGVLLESARAELGDRLTISDVEAGLQRAGFLPAGVDAERVTTTAAGRRVPLRPWVPSTPVRAAAPRTALP
jgi:GntR family transcriptional regulator/MocR family aminotransferase